MKSCLSLVQAGRQGAVQHVIQGGLEGKPVER